MQRCQHAPLVARPLPLALQRMLRALPHSHSISQHHSRTNPYQRAGILASASATGKRTYGPLPPPPAPSSDATSSSSSSSSTGSGSGRNDSPDFDELQLDDEYYREIGMTREEVHEEMMWHAADLDPDGMELSLDGATRPGMDSAGLSPELRTAIENLEVYGPEALVLAGFRAEEYGMIRATLDSVGGHAIKVLPANEQMLRGTVEAAVHWPEIDWDKPRPQEWVMGGGWGAQRAILFSGLGIKAQATVLELLESAGLPTICVTMALEIDAQRSVGEVLALAVKDQRKRKVPKGELWDVPGRVVNDTKGLQPVEQVIGRQRAAQRLKPQQVEATPAQQPQQRQQQPQQEAGPTQPPKQQQPKQQQQQQPKQQPKQQRQQEEPTHVAGLPLDNLDDDALLAWFHDPSTGPMFEMPMDENDPSGAAAMAAAAAMAGTGLPEDAVTGEAAGAGPAGSSMGGPLQGKAAALAAQAAEAPVDMSAAEARLLQSVLSSNSSTSTATTPAASAASALERKVDPQPAASNERVHAATSSTGSLDSATEEEQMQQPQVLQPAAASSDAAAEGTPSDAEPFSLDDVMQPRSLSGRGASTSSSDLLADLLDFVPSARAAAGRSNGSRTSSSGRAASSSSSSTRSGNSNVWPSDSATPASSPAEAGSRAGLEMPPLGEDPPSVLSAIQAALQRGADPEELRQAIEAAYAADKQQQQQHQQQQQQQQQQQHEKEEEQEVGEAKQRQQQRPPSAKQQRQGQAAKAQQKQHEAAQQLPKKQPEAAKQSPKKKQYGPAPPPPPSTSSINSTNSDPLLSLRPEAKRALEGRNVQYVDLSKLPSKYRQQYTSGALQQQRQQQWQAQQGPQVPAGPDAAAATEEEEVKNGAPDESLLRFPSGTYGMGAQQQQEEDDTSFNDDGDTGLSELDLAKAQQQQQRQQEEEDEEQEQQPVLDTDTILKLQESARAQGLDLQRLLAEAMASGMQVPPEAAKAAGVALPSSRMVEGARRSLLKQAKQAAAEDAAEEAATAAAAARAGSGSAEELGQGWGPVVREEADWQLREEWEQEQARQGAGAQAAQAQGASVASSVQPQQQQQRQAASAAEAATSSAATSSATKSSAGKAAGGTKRRGRIFGKEPRSSTTSSKGASSSNTTNSNNDGASSSNSTSSNDGGAGSTTGEQGSDVGGEGGTFGGVPTLEPSQQSVPGGASVLTRTQLEGVAARLGVPLEQLLEDARAKGIDIPDE